MNFNDFTKTYKRILIFTLLTALLLSGCRPRVDVNKEALIQATSNLKDYVYKFHSVEFSDGLMDNCNVLTNYKYSLSIMASHEYSDEGEISTYYIYDLNEEGTTNKLFSFSIANLTVNSYLLGTDDFLYFCLNDASNQNTYFIRKYDLKGTLISEKSFELSSIQALFDDEEGFFINGMVCRKDNILLISSVGILFFNDDGDFQKIISLKNLDSKIRNLEKVVVTKNSEVYVLSYDKEYKLSCNHVELSTFNIIDSFLIDGKYVSSDASLGNGHDLYFSTNNGIYYLDIATKDYKKILDFVASDIDAYTINSMAFLSQDMFYGTFYSEALGGYQMGFFTKVRPEDVKDKETINIGMLYTNYYVRKQAFVFNSTNDSYRINLIEYDSIYQGDQSEILKQISKDAASGEMPDILLIDSSFPVDIYINKNLFEDLTPFIEKDPEYNMDDLLPNVVDAYSVKGKLYQLVPLYQIGTMIGKVSNVGSDSFWTVEDALKRWDEFGPKNAFESDYDRAYMLNGILSTTKDTYIDWDNGTCSFDEGSFEKVLELLKRIPEKIDYSDVDWDEKAMEYRDDKTMVSVLSYFNYQTYNDALKGSFGEEINMIGYPSDKGNGSVIVPNLAFAVSSRSDVKDGAWEFLRYFLSDEFMSDIQYAIPIKKNLLYDMEKNSMEKPYYINADGEKEYYDMTYFIGGEEINIDPLSEEQAKMVTEYILSVNEPYRVDPSVSAIVSEEAQSYFNNQKSAEDVAKIIQSRVALYLAESR